MNDKKQLTLRMSNDLYEALIEIKNIKKISIPQLIISVVWKGIKEFNFLFQDWFYRVLFQSLKCSCLLIKMLLD